MKKILMIIGVFVGLALILCFIPFNADKFIPVLKTQFESNYGLKLSTSHLSIKFGPYIIIKSPELILGYEKDSEFAKLSGVKIRIAILPLLRNEIKVKDLRIDNADCKFISNDKGEFEIFNCLPELTNLNNIAKIRLKHYKFIISDDKKQDYFLQGSEFVISDFVPKEHIKIMTQGKLIIDGIKHIDYDVSLICDGLELIDKKKIDILDFLSEIKNKKASAGIVADLKIRKNNGDFKYDGSLSIDKMTFMVNNKLLPYSHASFTMLGNRVSVSSVVYTNQSDKIAINGYFTHTDNPSFNIAVKSNEIQLKDFLYFARLFSDISNFDRIKDINGTLYSDFILKGSLKRIKSTGVFKINNASVVTDKFLINNLNSDISFNDNKILINTAKAYINSAPVLISGEVISNKLNLNLIIDKYRIKNQTFNRGILNSGVLSVVANISGSYRSIVPKIEAELTNAAGSYDILKFKFNKLLFNLNNSSSGIISINNLIINTPYSQTFTAPNIKANFNDSVINIESNTFYSEKTKLNINGKVLNYKDEDLSFAFKGSGFVNPKGIFKIQELDNVYPIFFECNGNKLVQVINAQLLEQTSGAKISFAQPVIMNLAAKCINKELKILDCSVNTFKGVFTNNLKKNLASSSKLCVLTGSIDNLHNPMLKNIKLNFLKTCPLNIYHYMLKLNGNLVINGSVKHPEIIGNIKIPILTDKYGCLSAKNISASITKNLINFDCANLKIFDSSLSCVGTAESLLSNTFNVKSLNIKSKDLDLDNLSLMLVMLKESGININLDNGTMFSENVRIQTPHDAIYITDLNTTFKLKNNVLDIHNLSANMYNGKLVGNIKLNILTGEYSGLIQGRGISSGPIVKNMTSLKENIAGKLDFDMDLNSTIKSKFLKQANIKFIIRDGQMSTLGKVEHLLYAQNIIADNMSKTSLAVVGRAIGTKDSGLFKILNGILLINNDSVTIKSIKMLGPNMSLYITGHYGLMSNIANVNILGRLSNALVSSLGSFGTFTMNKFKVALTGEDEEVRQLQAGLDNLPQLSQNNTKEFKAIIVGPAESKNSVKSFMWISETIKEYRTKEINQSNAIIPKFIESLSY